MGKTVKFSLYAFLLFGLISPGLVFAAGIGVAPKSFELFAHPGQKATEYLSLTNTGAETAVYQVYPDSFESLIHIDPQTVTLAPQESVSIAITAENFPPGSYSTDISVVAESINDSAELPKTGVKIPYALHIDESLQAVNPTMTPWIIGLLLVALFLLLLSFYRNKKRGILRGTLDAIEETAAAGHPNRIAKHYVKRHRIFLLSLIALLLAGVLLLWSLFPSQTIDLSEGISTENEASYHVQIAFPDKIIEKSIESQDQVTPLSMLEYLQQSGAIMLKYDDPTEYGILVTEIDGYQNGENGLYWVYEVNDEQVPVSADRKILQPGDQLLWKFTTPTQ